MKTVGQLLWAAIFFPLVVSLPGGSKPKAPADNDKSTSRAVSWIAGFQMNTGRVRCEAKAIRCPDEVPITGWYRNYSYGFSIIIPAGLKGFWNSARCIKDGGDCVCMGDHGTYIPIRKEAYLDVVVGPMNYETRKE